MNDSRGTSKKILYGIFSAVALAFDAGDIGPPARKLKPSEFINTMI
jgi:hypothetical protein